ncbi:hypothetical protein EJ02DRAFT_422906 [Clathrospora elynae]|uniref:Uncharacterized protein n=1 Tax=Clathrospora elynae TaxID=706981 RepID=A0A6A5SQ25_9PLEO|nr:hypothetical protein EJ02DRAFT_422906 [Clathrospora elynae]
MAEPFPNPAAQPLEIDPTLLNGMATQPADVEMADPNTLPEPTEETAQPTPLAAAQPSYQPTAQTQPPTHAPAQAPTPTPAPLTAASSRNSPHPTAQAPTQPIPHGSPTRVYLNQHVTPHLLEAMKHLATQEPDKPLKWLSEFLAMKSAEIEGI